VPQVVRLADVLDDARLEWNRRRPALEDGVDERAERARVTVFLNDVTAAADERTNHTRQRLQPRHNHTSYVITQFTRHVRFITQTDRQAGRQADRQTWVSQH